MSVPKYIREIPRPKNTIVQAYGIHKDRYLVIQRLKSVKGPNGKYRPVNGPAIGHIIHGQYVPLSSPEVQNISMDCTDCKTWACYELCDRLFSYILEDLKKFYTLEDALKIYIMAILRVCEPGITDHRLFVAYDSSSLSEMYPGVPLSKDTVSTFQMDLGRTYSRIRKFMEYRCSKVHSDNHLIIDGTLKTNDSTVNDFSAYSRKAKLKNRQDISLLYAYNYETMEPVCSQCFPGNEIDSVSYKEFLETNNVTEGIVITDKGFSIEKVRDYFDSHPNLHYLNPLKRSTAYADQYHLYDYDGVLSLESDGPNDQNGVIYYKKAAYQTANGETHWLYSYKDVYRAMMEEESWAANQQKEKQDTCEVAPFNEALNARRETFGTIIMESDLELSPEKAYMTYDSRWDIEIMMRFYKTVCEFETTRVQKDFSVMGSEFINFLSVLLTYNLKSFFLSRPKLNGMSYKDIMDDLHRVKKIRMDDGTWKISRMLEKQRALLIETGILEAPPKKKRGRPKKEQAEVEEKPKRPRGRPRKTPAPDPDAPKRPRGRPKGSKNKPKINEST